MKFEKERGPERGKVRPDDLLSGFSEWWDHSGYATDFPGARRMAEHAWQAARGLKHYPCENCGKLRTESEGGDTFTVCDTCWDKYHSPEN